MDISRRIQMFLWGTLLVIVGLASFPRLNAKLNARTNHLYDQLSDRCVGPDGVETSKAYGGWPPTPRMSK